MEKSPEVVPPMGVTYKIPRSSDKLIRSRESIIFQSNKQTHNAGDTVDIDMMSMDFLDSQNSYLLFEFATDTTAARTWGPIVPSIIKEMRLSVGGVEIEHIQDVGLLMKLKYDHTVAADYRSGVLATMGYSDYYKVGALLDTANANYILGDAEQVKVNTGGNSFGGPLVTSTTTTAHLFVNSNPNSSLADHEALFTTTGRTLSVPLSALSGFFAQDKLIPMKLLGTLRLTLVLNTNAQALTVTGRSFTVSNPRIRGEMVAMETKVDAATFDAAKNGDLWINYSTWYSQTSAPLTAAGQQSISIQKNATNVDMIMCCARNTASLTSQTAYSFSTIPFHTSTTLGDQLQSWQFRIGSKYYPNSPVYNTFGHTETYLQAQRAWNILHDANCEGISYKKFLSDSYIVAANLDRDSSFKTGQSTVGGHNIVFEFNIGANAPAVTPTFFVSFTKMLKIIDYGRIQVVD